MEITKFSSYLFIGLEQASVLLRRALNALRERQKNVLEKMRAFLASSLDAVVEANGKIIKFRSQLFVALKQVTVNLRHALNPLMEWGKDALEKTQTLQESRRARENDLRELLASQVDSVVVTNHDRRFIAANLNALHLFGVSETNMRQFTIDAFLLEGEITHFDRNGLPFISREERQGQCKIRRLTGNLRIAEYAFVANFVSFRHLFIFRNDRECVARKTSCRRPTNAITGKVGHKWLGVS